MAATAMRPCSQTGLGVIMLADNDTDLQGVNQSIGQATELLPASMKNGLINSIAKLVKTMRSECCWWAAAHEVSPNRSLIC